MKFMTNRISTGKAKSFDDIIKKYTEKTMVKTAEADEGPSSGQLAVEPLHQKGESTEVKSSGGSSEGKKDEGKDSGQPKAEAKLVNEPKKEKDAGTEEEVKEAGIKGNCSKCGKPNFICKGKCDGSEEKDDDKKEEKDDDDKEAKAKEEDDEEDKEAKAKDKDGEEEEVKEAGKDERGKRDGTGPYKDSNQNETKGKGKRQENGEECPNKEASTKKKYVKLANLDDKTKSWLGDYWKKLYPPEYVDAMLADK